MANDCCWPRTLLGIISLEILMSVRGRIMTRLVGISILIVASAVMVSVQGAAAADATAHPESAPLQVKVAPTAVSSAPASIAFAPPRAAPPPAASATTPPENPQPEEPKVTVVVRPKDLLPSKGGYQRIVLHGKELFCRDDLATGSRLARTPLCLTAAQWQKQQLRAEEWTRDLEHRAAAMPANPMNIGGVER
jgi:hypothetical protein